MGNEKVADEHFNRQTIVNKRLREAYAELKQIFNSTADGMCIIDKEFNILRVNEIFLQMFGLRKIDVLHKKCFKLLPGANCHTPNCSLRRLFTGESFVEQEIEKNLVNERN